MGEGVSRRAGLAIAAAATAIGLARRPTQAQVTGGGAGGGDGTAYRSVGELRAMLDARQVSAVELLGEAIRRIEARDPAINAVVVRDFERARAAARLADAALARGERQPLLGIPMTVKESFNVAGLPTTWGLPMGRGWVPPEDAVAVARLKAAGAVILGKTNIGFALGDWQSFNPIYGSTNNPWNVARTAGGSSGGSAAALAAGFVPLELGSDISGSLRVPAHFCGVMSHKPSTGLVSQRGHDPPRSMALQTDLTSGLGVVGPMARNVADLVLALDLLAGPDENEAGAYRLTLPPARHADLRSFRVLVVDAHPLLPVSAAVRGALDRLANRLRGAGVTVAHSSSLLPDLAEAARLHTRMIRNVVNFGRPPDYFRTIAAEVAALPPADDSLRAWRLRAPLMTHHQWMAAEVARARLRQQWAALFQQFDLVLCPPFAVAAFPHDHLADQEERFIDIDGTQHPYLSMIVWNTLATVPGLPATVMPIERAEGGLPIGVQIIGPLLEDRTPLAFARFLEREFGGFVPPPF